MDPVRRDWRGATGHIGSRLLVNALADPDEVSRRLPQGLRPHIIDGGSVIGCCLLELSEMRLGSVPAQLGHRMLAVAHRLSVEWTSPSGEAVVGVYVPLRLTSSRLATLAGGRVVPGVHRHARLSVNRDSERLRWWADPAGSPTGFGLDVAVDTVSSVDDPQPVVGSACLDAQLGLSPGRGGRLEAVRMMPTSVEARPVVTPVVTRALNSTFLNGFSGAVPTTSYLMEDVDVTWSPSPKMVPLSVAAVPESVR